MPLFETNINEVITQQGALRITNRWHDQCYPFEQRMRRQSILDLQVSARQAVLAELRRRDMSALGFGDLVGMSEPGASMLLEKEYWSLDTSITAALALGMDVQLLVKPPKTKIWNSFSF